MRWIIEMLTTNTLMNAVEAELKRLYPGEPVYYDELPKDFPAALLYPGVPEGGAIRCQHRTGTPQRDPSGYLLCGGGRLP